MMLAVLLFVLLFVVLVACGTLVHMYLYKNKAFHKGTFKQVRKPALSVASFSQTATIPTPDAAVELYYGGIGVRNEDEASIHVRRFMLYSVLGILSIFVALVVLVLGATRF